MPKGGSFAAVSGGCDQGHFRRRGPAVFITVIEVIGQHLIVTRAMELGIGNGGDQRMGVASTGQLNRRMGDRIQRLFPFIPRFTSAEVFHDG
ncbi:MAG: hypothetical protein PVI27_13205 [Desulfobacteraceae bacterium]|jgi:hypothetical protein